VDVLAQKQIAELDTKLGKIKVQTPSLKKKLEIERRRSMYAGGLAVISQTGAELSDLFATLDVVMIECPLKKDSDSGTWDYDDVFDEDALRDAYTKAVEWLDSFRKGLAEKQA